MKMRSVDRPDPQRHRQVRALVLSPIRPMPPQPDADPTKSFWRTAAARMTEVGANLRRLRMTIAQESQINGGQTVAELGQSARTRQAGTSHRPARAQAHTTSAPALVVGPGRQMGSRHHGSGADEPSVEQGHPQTSRGQTREGRSRAAEQNANRPGEVSLRFRDSHTQATVVEAPIARQSSPLASEGRAHAGPGYWRSAGGRPPQEPESSEQFATWRHDVRRDGQRAGVDRTSRHP